MAELIMDSEKNAASYRSQAARKGFPPGTCDMILETELVVKGDNVNISIIAELEKEGL